MMKTSKEIVEADGQMHWNEMPDVSETALLSEAALREDWNRPEEDEAWSHLQQVRASSLPSP